MEMHGKGRNFSSETPKWAKIFMVILTAIFCGVSLGSLCLAILGFYTKDSAFILLGTIFAVTFAWVGKVGFTSLKVYEKWSYKVRLTGDGYFMEVIDKQTFEVHKELIRYDQMEEVVISKALNYIPKEKYSLLIPNEYFINALLIIIWRDETGKKHTKLFTHSNKTNLDEWLKMFDQHSIPITVTDIDFRGVPADELLPSLERTHKKTYKWDGAFEKVLRVGSVTREKPLKLEGRFKKRPAFRIPIKHIYLLTILFNSWFIYRAVSHQNLDFSVIALPVQINILLSGLFMYFTRKLAVKSFFKYLGFTTIFFWSAFLLLREAGIISFPFTDDLVVSNFMIFMVSCTLYPFIKYLRNDRVEEYHEERKDYYKRLENAGYKMMD